MLATRSRPPLPRWVDAAVVALLAVFLVAGTFAGLRATPYGTAEAAQLALTKDAATLVTDPLALVPGGDTTQPAESLRLVQGAFTRYVSAAGWYIAGGRAADVPALPADGGTAAGAAPPERLLTAARVAPVLFAAAAIPVLFFLGLRLGGRRVALIAVVAAFVHPSVLLAGRQVQDVGAVLAFGLGRGARRRRRLASGSPPGVNPGAGRWTALVVLCGCTLAAGQGALGFVGGAVAWVLAGFGEVVPAQPPGAAGRAPARGVPPPDAAAGHAGARGHAAGPAADAARRCAEARGGRRTGRAGRPRAARVDRLVRAVAGRRRVRVGGGVAVAVGLAAGAPRDPLGRAVGAGRRRGCCPTPARSGTSGATWRLFTGPFLDAPDQVPSEALSAGLPYTGWALPVGLLLALATLAGVVLLVVAAAAGPQRRAEPRPLSFSLGAGRLRWLAARQIGRRDAVALLGWSAVVALCAVAWPSERSADRVPLVPVAALFAAVALVVRSVASRARAVRSSPGRGRRDPHGPGASGSGRRAR